MAYDWDFWLFTFTGFLSLGWLGERVPLHTESGVGWTPPAVLDEREVAPPLVTDWLSPAKLRELAAPEEAKRPELPPPGGRPF